MGENKLTKFAKERKLYDKDGQSEAHRERLKNFSKRIMTTIMVGAIDEFEKHFGEVWGHKIHSEDKNDDELDMTVVWNMCRNEIFDRGNTQIRNMFKELDTYNVEVIRTLSQFTPKKI